MPEIEEEVVVIETDENTDNGAAAPEGEVIETDETAEVPEWQKTGEEVDETDKKPVKFLKAKKRLKGTITEQESEIDQLKKTIEAMQQPAKKEEASTLKRPHPDDYSFDEDYEKDLEAFEDAKAAERYDRISGQKKVDKRTADFQAQLTEAVDEHFERADKLIEEHGIDPEIYKQSDIVFRKSIEEVLPGKGDQIADVMISKMGEGSEKVCFALGRNKEKREKFQNLFRKDPTGIEAALYLGEQKASLSKPLKRSSEAPAPAPKLNGEVSSNAEAKLRREYDTATKSGNYQKAFDLKRDAKKTHKINTTKW